MKRHLFTYLFILVSAVGFGQVDINVFVTDQLSAAPIDQVQVQLSNAEIGYSVSAKTDADGNAQFRSLSISGEYTITIAETSTWYGNTISGIELRSNYNPSIIISLTKKSEVALGEVKIVGNKTAQMNTSNAEVAGELKISEIKQIPVEGRDISRVLYRLPNVTQATGFYPEAPNVSINGSNGLFTNYLIDGMDNNEQFLGGQRFAIPV